MGILETLAKRPDPCTGPHDFHPHDHSWWPAVAAEYRGKRKCTASFWCVKCWEWSAGEACKPLAA